MKRISAALDVREVSGAGNGWFTGNSGRAFKAEGTGCVKAQRSDDLVRLEEKLSKKVRHLPCQMLKETDKDKLEQRANTHCMA